MPSVAFAKDAFRAGLPLSSENAEVDVGEAECVAEIQIIYMGDFTVIHRRMSKGATLT